MLDSNTESILQDLDKSYIEEFQMVKVCQIHKLEQMKEESRNDKKAQCG